MQHPYRPPFETILEAQFVARPNRFVVHCRLDTGEEVRAFLPNPGRLQELLLPAVTVYLVPEAPDTKRKTRYTMVGVAGAGAPIFLHTHVNNDVARHLLDHDLVPGLEGATIVRAEVPLGRSRFDFLLDHHGAPVYVEVKSCTLFGNGVAMFPDAVTARGKRHLEELAELADSGIRTAVVFVVHSGKVDWFMPDYHTDLAFSQTLLAVRDRVTILPMAIPWTGDFTLAQAPRLLPIPWEHVAREAADRGNWLLIANVDGGGEWREGYYLVAGWCGKNLAAEIRALRRGGRGASSALRSLLGEAYAMEIFPIVSSTNHAGALLDALDESAALRATALSLSDASRGIGIRAYRANPILGHAFHHVLARFRMASPRG